MNLASMLWLGLVGCSGSQPILNGTPLWEMFPFDGGRTWEYKSTDLELPYKLIATSTAEPEKKGTTNIYVVEYWTQCVGASDTCVDGEVLRRIKWSSTVTEGVLIHAYDPGPGFIDLDPPLMIAEKEMLKNDTVDTETGGAVWTSTFLGIEECPVALNAAWDECAALQLTVDEGDGAPLVGTYWVTKGNGLAGLELDGENGQWQLSSIDCAPPEDCDGKW